MQQDKDPVNTPATPGGFEKDKLKVLEWLSRSLDFWSPIQLL